MRCTVLLAVVALAPCAAIADSTPTFYTDPGSGCQVGTFYPKPGLGVQWNGPCTDGKADGRGIAEWSLDGKFYVRSEGLYQRGLREGRVITIDKDGNVSQYEFRGGRYTGRCIQTLANGNRFDGVCADDKQVRGRMWFPDGARYDGEVLNGKFHGHGVYMYPNGSIYDGNFENGKQSGRGRFVGAGGSWYEGDYRDGDHEGEGVYVWGDDGAMYRGHWRASHPDGAGVYRGLNTRGQLREISGQWRNGCLRTSDGGEWAITVTRRECGFD